MATSTVMSTSNDKIKYTISITQNSQNITNNTSNVTVKNGFESLISQGQKLEPLPLIQSVSLRLSTQLVA